MSSSKKINSNTLDYEKSGVSVDRGYEFVEKIKPLVKKTRRKEILSGLGSFSALSKLPSHIKNPLLVTCTDGVGTKVEIAKQLNKFNTIGIDLVAMCVNDLITCGAEPLLFLDYYVTDKLKVSVATEVIKGIVKGCELSNSSLVGGETAEHPGTFPKNSFDLAGFSVGIVDEKKIINGDKLEEGDDLIGLASSGLHSNGFSLIRALLQNKKINLNSNIGGLSLGEALLKPTRIYVKSILDSIKKTSIKGISHITGGGLVENIPRISSNHLSYNIKINKDMWPTHNLFSLIQDAANLEIEDMYNTFNCGIGIVIACDPQDSKNLMDNLKNHGEIVHKIGSVEKNIENLDIIKFN